MINWESLGEDNPQQARIIFFCAAATTKLEKSIGYYMDMR